MVEGAAPPPTAAGGGGGGGTTAAGGGGGTTTTVGEVGVPPLQVEVEVRVTHPSANRIAMYDGKIKH